MRVLWKITKVFGNIFGIMLSIFLCIALSVMLIATPLVSGLSSFTRPETIRQVVQNVDFAKIFMGNMMGELSDEERKEMEFLIELTQTKAFGDLIELYATDMTNAFEKGQRPSVLTKEALRKIVRENMDEMIRIVRRMGETMGEDTSSYTDEELEEEVWIAFEELADRFLEMVPTVDDLRSFMGKISDELTTDSIDNDERPNSGMEFGEDSYDTPSYEFGEEDSEGGSITYIPGDGDTITSIIINGDGTIQSGNGEGYSYYVDPETGAIVIVGADGAFQGHAAVSGGTMSFGKPVAVRGGIRVLAMGLGSSGNQGQVEIPDWFLQVTSMAKDGTLTLLFVAGTVLLALLICLLRWPRFKGFMWVAIVLLIGATVAVGIGLVCTIMPDVIMTVAGDEASTISVVQPVIKVIANSFYVTAAIYAGIAIVLIVLFSVFRRLLEKQKKAKAAALAQTDAAKQIVEQVQICEETPVVEEVVSAEETTAEETEILEEQTAAE